jgi:hypothetical protein
MGLSDYFHPESGRTFVAKRTDKILDILVRRKRR